MSIPSEYEFVKGLVSNIIESTLQNRGEKEYQKIVKRLKKDSRHIPDFFDDPKYFNEILTDEFGESFIEIIYSMHSNMGESASNEIISKFLIESIKGNSEILIEDSNMTSAVILMSIEKALLEMGAPELDKVESKLSSDFNCTLRDCVRNPTPLKKVLCELFGNCYGDIYQSITKSLIVTSLNETSTKFLIIMKE